MAFENTMTEQGLDASEQQQLQSFRAGDSEFEPDLAVDGLSESILSRLLGLFGVGRS
jgi:hypothetical protein